MKAPSTFLLFLLAGCAASPTASELAEFESTIPVCVSEDDCEHKWAAARRWIIDNADFKLDIYTDDYMETFSSPGYNSTMTWARATKEPLGEGRYAIVVAMGCNNPFGCTARPMDQKILFNKYVASFGEDQVSEVHP